MPTKESINKQMKIIRDLLEKQVFNVSKVDQAIQDTNMLEFSNENGIRFFSTILLDLNQKRHVVYRSIYSEYLKMNTTSIDVHNNLFIVNNSVHPGDIGFFLETFIIILEHLELLKPFETKSFMVVFTVKLLEVDGGYKTYMCHVCVKKEDANGKSWILKIEAVRQEEVNFPIFRKFFAAPEDYTETHEYSLFLHNLKLTTQQMEILKLKTQKKSAGQIAATLGISVKTVNTHYSNINEKMKLDAIDVSARVAGAFGWNN